MNQTNTPHADPVEDQVVTGVDGEELSELISQYEESAKNTSNDKDEDGGKLRTFQNKIFKGVLRYTAIALALYHIYALIFQLPIPLVLYSIHWGMGLTYAFVYYPSYKGNKKALRKTFGVIDAILAMNARLGIPTGFSCIREEDLPQMAAWAAKEANPTYPVPVIYDRGRFIRVIRQVMQ